MPNMFGRVLSWICFGLVAGFILATTVRADPVDVSLLSAAHSSRSFAVETHADGGIDGQIVTRR